MRGITVNLIGKRPAISISNTGLIVVPSPIPPPHPGISGWIIGTSRIGLARINPDISWIVGTSIIGPSEIN